MNMYRTVTDALGIVARGVASLIALYAALGLLALAILVSANRLRGLLRAWILGGHYPTQTLGTGVTDALSPVDHADQDSTRSHTPCTASLSGGFSRPNSPGRRYLPGDQVNRSEGLRIGTENLRKSLDTWPVSLIDWNVSLFLSKPKTDISGMSEILPYIPIYHDMSDLSSQSRQNGQIRNVGYFSICFTCFECLDSPIPPPSRRVSENHHKNVSTCFRITVRRY